MKSNSVSKGSRVGVTKQYLPKGFFYSLKWEEGKTDQDTKR